MWVSTTVESVLIFRPFSTLSTAACPSSRWLMDSHVDGEILFAAFCNVVRFGAASSTPKRQNQR